MSTLFEKILPYKNVKREILEKLSISKKPLLIYGIAEYAFGVKRFLQKYNIKIDAAFVDMEFIDKKKKQWDDIPVVSFEEVSICFNSFNVIIGIANYKLAKTKLSRLVGCDEVFFIDSTLNIDFFNYAFIKQNWDSFVFTYNLLQDNISKSTFIAFINAKLTSQSDELFDLVKFDQYFPQNIINLSDNEIFVDAGAYTGDTILQFIDKVKGEFKRIYAIEPDRISFIKLSNTIKDSSLKNVSLYNMGVWESNSILLFDSDLEIGARSALSEIGTISLEVDSIDNIVDNNVATFIKMDIEGAELPALKGAINTIVKSKPKLAISVYHKPEDLITIPQYISRIMPNYKFYLRHHSYITHELVLYAV